MMRPLLRCCRPGGHSLRHVQQRPGWDRGHPGAFGFRMLASSDPEVKAKKLRSELADGALAMIANIDVFFQDGLTGSACGNRALCADSSQRRQVKTALSAFESELGAQPPTGCWTPWASPVTATGCLLAPLRIRGQARPHRMACGHGLHHRSAHRQVSRLPVALHCPGARGHPQRPGSRSQGAGHRLGTWAPKARRATSVFMVLTMQQSGGRANNSAPSSPAGGSR